MKNSKYLRLAIVFIGFIVFAFFCLQAITIFTNPPQIPQIDDSLTKEAAAASHLSFEEAKTRWNNQFAKKSFFSLVGLFLLLIAILPKKKIWIPKVLFSAGLVSLIIHHLLADGKISSIMAEGISLSIFWIAMAFIVKGSGMWCTIWRWKTLLEGQGFKIPLRHLVESFLIGRFIGSFAPGTSGLDGYRAYDIARYTGKVARSLAVIFVEKLIGFFVLGSLLLVAIPVGSALFASKEVNSMSLVMMALVFVGMMLASMIVLFKPSVIRWITDKFIPKNSPIRKKVNKAIQAASAYENRKLYLVKALAIGFGVHVCTCGMYFCTARAILAIGGTAFEVPPVSALFATAVLMIGATVMPLSIAGIGMREGVFAFFLGPIAAIYAFGGYLVGEIISLFGGPVWLLRRTNYYEVMKAQRDAVNQDVDDENDDDDFEDLTEKRSPIANKPSVFSYAFTGLGAGLMAGLGIAIIDSARLWSIGGGIDWSLPGYASLLYGPLLGLIGIASGVFLALFGRLVQKEAEPIIKIGTFIGFVWFGIFVLAIGFFFLQRDVFGEKAGLFSPQMLGSVLVLLLGVLSVGVGFSIFLRKLFSCKLKRFSSQWVPIAIWVFGTVVFVILWNSIGVASSANNEIKQSLAKKGMPNILLVMNDTHRADYVGSYNSSFKNTPNLDALAADGIVYTNAFAQASWTRPSVCTLLTGRYPSSHTAILKGSMLPDEITTLAEVLEDGGYDTLGVATNYNLTPFFNVDQGFRDYSYLAPNLPLGSTDEQSKLIFIEIAKKVVAKLKGKKETPKDYYVIGETVTKHVLDKIDLRIKDRPFFMFASYMDVHDPYFSHPYNGYGISHRSNPNPDINDKAFIAEMKELYAGEVKYWDEQFGKLIDGLKKRNLYDDTLIVVVSDHGEEFGEHGGFWHGTTLYDEQLRIIYITKYPQSSGIDEGVKIADWRRLLDVAPFLITEAGLNVPKEMQGVAFHKNAKTPVFAEEDHQGNILTSIRYASEGEEIKYIEANKANPRGLKQQEMYKVNDDLVELENIAKKSPDKLGMAQAALDFHKQKAKEGAASGESKELTAEQKAALCKLGYMECE